MKRTARLLGRATGLSRQERRDAIVAVFWLGYANLALKLRPFSKAIALGSVSIGPAPPDPARTVRAAIRAVERASYAAPWRTVCIHEGLALQRILRGRGIPAVLCYGTRAADGQLKSHVWVRVGDEVVIGGEEASNYHLVATYPLAENSSTSRPFSSLST